MTNEVLHLTKLARRYFRKVQQTLSTSGLLWWSELRRASQRVVGELCFAPEFIIKYRRSTSPNTA